MINPFLFAFQFFLMILCIFRVIFNPTHLRSLPTKWMPFFLSHRAKRTRWRELISDSLWLCFRCVFTHCSVKKFEVRCVVSLISYWNHTQLNICVEWYECQTKRTLFTLKNYIEPYIDRCQTVITILWIVSITICW